MSVRDGGYSVKLSWEPKELGWSCGDCYHGRKPRSRVGIPGHEMPRYNYKIEGQVNVMIINR